MVKLDLLTSLCRTRVERWRWNCFHLPNMCSPHYQRFAFAIKLSRLCLQWKMKCKSRVGFEVLLQLHAALKSANIRSNSEKIFSDEWVGFLNYTPECLGLQKTQLRDLICRAFMCATDHERGNHKIAVYISVITRYKLAVRSKGRGTRGLLAIFWPQGDWVQVQYHQGQVAGSWTAPGS